MSKLSSLGRLGWLLFVLQIYQSLSFHYWHWLTAIYLTFGLDGAALDENQVCKTFFERLLKRRHILPCHWQQTFYLNFHTQPLPSLVSVPIADRKQFSVKAWDYTDNKEVKLRAFMGYFYEFDENIYALSEIKPSFKNSSCTNFANMWYNVKIVL